jgi:YD repeat-containing protein
LNQDFTTTRVIRYTYDPLYRLVEADHYIGERFEYAYDAVGNPVSATLRGTNCRLALTTSVTVYTPAWVKVRQ